MDLSIVATLYKSEPYVAEFHERASREARKLSDDYEIILVDDGSPDESLKVARGLVESDPRLRVVELSRNYGHHKAMMTGLERAKGEKVFLIDVDLEEPPELLGTFDAALRDGPWDVVYGYQSRRKGGVVERFAGAAAWRLIGLLLPIKIPANHSTVRLMTRAYKEALVRHKEHKTAIGGLWVITGFKQKGVEFAKGSRGASAYGLWKRMEMMLDSITSFSETPLLFVFFLGLGILACSMAVGAGLIALRLTGTVLEGWVSVMVSVWMLGGLAIFCIGVVGLYVSRIFIETKARPYTIVRDVYEKKPAGSARQG